MIRLFILISRAFARVSDYIFSAKDLVRSKVLVEVLLLCYSTSSL